MELVLNKMILPFWLYALSCKGILPLNSYIKAWFYDPSFGFCMLRRAGLMCVLAMIHLLRTGFDWSYTSLKSPQAHSDKLLVILQSSFELKEVLFQSHT